jgi:hypothetical protein
LNLPNNSIGSCLALFDAVSGRADCPDDESTEHTSGGDKEEFTTTDFINKEASGDGSDKVEDLEDLVRG